MSRRAVPTRPGWWWVGTFDGDRVFDLSVVEVCRFDGGLRARFNGDWFEFEQVTRAWHGTRDWIEPVANPETIAALVAERDVLLAKCAHPSAASVALDRLAERFPREALAPGISSPSWDDLVDWALAVVRERDEAQAALARIYVESGADPDGNDPATESGISHLWPKAEAAVRELRRDHRDISGLVEQYEKYTEILCPDCGAPTDGLPDGWPAS